MVHEMDKITERQATETHQKETDKVDSPVSLLKVTVLVVSNPFTKKTPGIDGFIGEFHQTFGKT